MKVDPLLNTLSRLILEVQNRIELAAFVASPSFPLPSASFTLPIHILNESCLGNLIRIADLEARQRTGLEKLISSQTSDLQSVLEILDI